MYQPVFTRAVLTGSADAEFSQPISMEGANTAQFDYVVFSIGASTTLSVQIQASNDLENWDLLGSANTSTLVEYKLSSSVTVAAAYVRLKIWLSAGSNTVVVAAGINTSNA